MKWLQRILGSAGGTGRPRDPDGFYFYVRCGRCGQKLQLRADLRFDLMQDLDEGGYVLHKDMMDSKCFSMMHATVRFDENRQAISQDIEGGTFITEVEFHQPDS